MVWTCLEVSQWFHRVKQRLHAARCGSWSLEVCSSVRFAVWSVSNHACFEVRACGGSCTTTGWSRSWTSWRCRSALVESRSASCNAICSENNSIFSTTRLHVVLLYPANGKWTSVLTIRRRRPKRRVFLPIWNAVVLELRGMKTNVCACAFIRFETFVSGAWPTTIHFMFSEFYAVQFLVSW